VGWAIAGHCRRTARENAGKQPHRKQAAMTNIGTQR
jgi:hypothetical protein